MRKINTVHKQAAQNIDNDRNPVVVIPGMLSSILEKPGSERPIWGSFTCGAAHLND